MDERSAKIRIFVVDGTLHFYTQVKSSKSFSFIFGIFFCKFEHELAHGMNGDENFSGILITFEMMASSLGQIWIDKTSSKLWIGVDIKGKAEVDSFNVRFWWCSGVLWWPCVLSEGKVLENWRFLLVFQGMLIWILGKGERRYRVRKIKFLSLNIPKFSFAGIFS